MSFYRTTVYDFVIAEKYRGYFTNVYKHKCWYYIPDLSVWEKVDFVYKYTLTSYFPYTGSYDERSGRVSFVADFNLNSHHDYYEMDEIFDLILPDYSDKKQPYFHSAWDEGDYDKTDIYDENSMECTSVEWEVNETLDSLDDYHKVFDGWHESYPHCRTRKQPRKYCIIEGKLHNYDLVSPILKEDLKKAKTVLPAIPEKDVISPDGRLIIPEGVSSISPGCFRNNEKLKFVELPSGIKVDESAFASCPNLREAVISEAVYMSEKVFAECHSLESVTYKGNMDTLPAYTFFGCFSLRSPAFPPGVRLIEKRAFAACRFENVVIPNTVRTIGSGTFQSCSQLQKVTIPDSVEEIGCNVFSCCDSLKEIEIPYTVCVIGDRENDNRTLAACADVPEFSHNDIVITGKGMSADVADFAITNDLTII